MSIAARSGGGKRGGPIAMSEKNICVQAGAKNGTAAVLLRYVKMHKT